VITFLLSAETNTTSSGSPWFSLIFFGAIFAAMYFLLLRPQRRRVKESQNLQSSIAVDDEVILNSGIYGFVTAIEGDILWLDVADGHDKERIEIRVARGSVARKAPVAASDSPESEAK
jgi:preprotein translocase subunit YajC